MNFGMRIAGKTFHVYYITEPTQAYIAVTRLIAAKVRCLGFDIETGKHRAYLSDSMAGLCPYRSFPSLIQFYDGAEHIYMFDALSIPLPLLKPIFAAKHVVAHNAVFDMQHMQHAGIPIRADCSMIMFHLVQCAQFASNDEENTALNDRWDIEEGDGQLFDWLGTAERYGASLRAVSAKLLNLQIEKDHQTSNWTDRPLSREQLAYAAKDSWLTYEVGKILTRRIKRLGLARVYLLNRQAMRSVVDMVLTGMQVDTQAHRLHIKTWSKRKDHLEVKIAKIFGSSANVRSTHQISKWLELHLPPKLQHSWPRSEKTGKLRSDARSLQTAAHLPFAAPLCEYKKLDKMLGTYGEPLLRKICPVTGRLHGSFTLGYTATGRLSSRNPNLQNLPRDSNIRAIFTAPSEHVLVGADLNQIELRCAGELSRDCTMRSAYKKGIDLHSYLASRISGTPLKLVTKEQRSLSKAINFGLLYGLGARGLVDYANWNYGVPLSEDEAYGHVRTFYDTFADYARWQQEQRAEAERSGTVTTQLGKLRRLQKEGAYTRSVNHPVQGSAAEIVITALNYLHKELRGSKVIKMTNCIHDEILLEVHEDATLEARRVLQSCMEKAARDVFPRISLNKLVDVKTCKTWAEMK